MKKVLLIDGNSLFFRAFYATFYNGVTLTNKEGIPTNALYGFANMLTKLLKTKYDYNIVAFDTHKPTFRHLSYDGYKAGRAETPQELLIQFPLAKELLKDMGLFPYELEGYEADDIIGTMARLSKEKGYEVDVYTGDRDLLQLIDDTVTVNLTKKGVTELHSMTKEVLKEEMGITPLQIIDLKGLMGDSSDNLPGIKGVGEKTALKLLDKYQNLENVLAATDIKGKLAEKITTYKEDAIMSKRLATICTTVPLTFDYEDSAVKEKDLEKLNAFYKKYDMNSLIVYEEQETNFKFETVEKIDVKNETVSIYLDVAKDNYHVDDILGMGVSTKDKNYYITFENLLKNNDFLSDESVNKICFDKKMIMVVLTNHNIKYCNLKDDFMIMAYLVNSSVKDDISLIFKEYGESVHKEKNDITYIPLVSSLVIKYYEKAMQQLKEKELYNLYQNIELPLVDVLSEMELTGFKVDGNKLDELQADYEKKLNALEKEIINYAGEDFNINSPTQVAHILYDKLGIKSNRKRSTAVQELEKIIDEHPIVPLILEHRKYAKMISNYTQGLKNYILKDGRIHTIFNQTLTQTGRLSSKDPNLQNISARDAETREVRHAFIASNKQNYILSFDYSQIELRVLAFLANSKTMMDAFNAGIDIHALTASKVFNKDVKDVTDSERRTAKVVNFGIVYGMSAWGLSEELHIGANDANKLVEDCKINGYVRTYFNRLRYVPEINNKSFQMREFGRRVALNTPIQGTAADIIKLAMIKVNNMLHEHHFETKMILQIHDELVFDVPYYELMEVMPLIEDIMENVVDFKMKLKVEGNYGYDYY